MSDNEMKLAQALHEASVYGIGATSDVNQRVILEAAKAFAAAASAEPVAYGWHAAANGLFTTDPRCAEVWRHNMSLNVTPVYTHPAPDAEIVAALEDQIDAGAQALVNDHWHPPQPLYVLNKSEANRFRRMARLVLEAALTKAKGAPAPASDNTWQGC